MPSMPAAGVRVLLHALTAADLCYALIALARSMLVAAESALLTPDRAQHANGWCAHVVACTDSGRLVLRSYFAHARPVLVAAECTLRVPDDSQRHACLQLVCACCGMH